MPVLADDDVVMDGDAERLGGIDDRLGHLDIGARRGRVAARMVMDQDDGGGGKLQSATHDFPRIDGRVVDRALALHLVRDECIALVEEQDADVFPGLQLFRICKHLEDTSPKRP